MPLYNKARSVAATIRSVLAQSFVDFELIVVNDGSTDESRERVLEFQDERIALIDQPNGGVSNARNAGIALAAAPYVAMLDADDTWHPQHLERIHALTRVFPDASGYATRYAFRHGATRQAPSLPRLKRITPQLINDYFRHVADGDMLLTASSACIPAQVLKRIGGFPAGERIGEDQDLWIRVALDGPIAWDDRCSVDYRQDTETQATRSKVEPDPWPFAMRLLRQVREGGVPGTHAADARRYAARQLVGQASLLLLDGQPDAARRLLKMPEARSIGRRYYYWRTLSRLPRPFAPLLRGVHAVRASRSP
jgi:hypothetical protein